MDVKGIPPVHSPENLVDIAYRHASKEAGNVRIRDRSLRRKRAEERRVKEASLYITTYLSKLERLRERIETSPPFYLELLDITVGREEISKTFDAVALTRKNISRMEERIRRDIRMSKGDSVVLRKEFYGKTSSVLRRIAPHLEQVGRVVEAIKNFPTIQEGYTVVIAGMPNVGKSSLLKQLTTSKPEIKPYPFTTKSILVGYIEKGYRIVQVIDTPGLLDRPLEERNPIERQAVLALTHLAHLIIFLFDPTETCGFSIDSQLALYSEIARNFQDVVPVINKSDVASESSIKAIENGAGKKTLQCSAKEGWVEDVMSLILSSQKRWSTQAPPQENRYPI